MNKISKDPVIELYKKDIDRSLIKENLKLTVEERLQNLKALQLFAATLRKAHINAQFSKDTHHTRQE